MVNCFMFLNDVKKRLIKSQLSPYFLLQIAIIKRKNIPLAGTDKR
jgi:hypothetical protein